VSVRRDEIHVATLRELAEAHVEIARLTKALDEREADMHMRIRAGYDKTVADAWRAEVAKRDAEIADLRALVESQRRDYLDVCDAIAPETSGPADAAAKVRALRAMVERHGEHLRAGADAVRSANASTAEIGARMEAAGEEIEALRAKLAEATSLLRSAGDLFVEIQTTDGEDEHKAITDGAKLSAAISAALEAL
jgi:chromosome segregation ATPase